MATTLFKLILTLLTLTFTTQATPMATPTIQGDTLVPRQAAIARVIDGDFSTPFRTQQDGLIWTAYGYKRVKLGSNYVAQLDPTTCPPDDFLYGALFGIQNVENIVGGKTYTCSFQYRFSESTSVMWDRVSLNPDQGPKNPKLRYVLTLQYMLDIKCDADRNCV